MPSAPAKPEAQPQPTRSWYPVVGLGWLIPGGGYFLLKRPGRGALVLASVLCMFLLGLMMRGAMFQPQTGDILTTVIYVGGFIGDLASGLLYLLTVWLGYNQPDMAGPRPRLRHQVPGGGRSAQHFGHGGRLRDRDWEKRLNAENEFDSL